jgi:hypothetical protein
MPPAGVVERGSDHGRAITGWSRTLAWPTANRCVQVQTTLVDESHGGSCSKRLRNRPDLEQRVGVNRQGVVEIGDAEARGELLIITQ